jgi:DNA-binding winged helix-turn-helix (wHTH) protein
LLRLTFANFELGTALYELRRNGAPDAVEPRVFDLLVYLASHKDRIVSRGDLLSDL